MSRSFLGIDPGEKGGIAVLNKEGEIKAYNMPETMADIYDLIQALRLENGPEITACLEDVGHGMPGQSSVATAKFARHNGHIEMALYALGIMTVKVTPQKWQKYYSNSLGKKTSDMKKTKWKNRLKGLAQQMFPYLKITLNTADAVLIANYISKQ